MKMLGWRSVGFATFYLGPSTVLVLAVWLFGHNGAKVHQGFYEAAAQILPILLLAHIVRLATLRDLSLAGRDRLRAAKSSAREDVAKLRARTEKAGGDEDLLRSLDGLEKDLNLEEVSDGERSAEETIEILAGNLFGTLVLGMAGGSAILTELAMEADTRIIFTLASLALVTMTIGLVTLEIVVFTTPKFSASR